ncbi:MAG: LCP family protein [Bacilli bacterium]|nr:LCP family protein [Bacilli bacterium]
MKKISIYKIVKFVFFLLGLIASLVFGICAIASNYLPTKYVVLLVGILIVFNLIWGLMLFTRKKVINIIAMILVLLYSGVLFVGFVYLNKTINIIKQIVTLNEERVNYLVLSSNSDVYTDINSLAGTKVGILQVGSEDLIEEFNNKVNVEYVKYTSVGDLIYGIQLGEVSAIIISMTMYDLVLEENPDFEFMVTKLGEFEVVGEPIKIESSIEMGESFIVYLSGLDTRDTSVIWNAGLSDVNILAVVNPTTHKILLINIPRDYYVQVAGTEGLKDKLTHAGLYGVEASTKTVENLFDINVNAFVKVNFKVLTTVVDEIDGIDVYSDTGFNSFHLRGWYVKKGWNHMDGKKALAYSRERYAYATGDRHRGQNQQDIITAIINKISQNKEYLLKYTDILEAVQPCISTNIEATDIQELVKEQIDTLAPWTVESISVNGTNAYNYTYSFPKQSTYVMIPDQATIDSARARINEVMKES